MATIQELQEQKRVLSGMKGMEKEISRIDAQIAAMQSGSSAGAIVLPGVTEEDYEKSGSKFAVAGLHLSEFGMPTWDTPGISLAFPFTIVAGNDKGKEAKISAGVSKSAVWKLKEILGSLGVAIGKDKSGNVTFDPMAVVGKQGMTLWVQQRDSRSAEEGGKGTVYTKPVSVQPIGSEPPADLGIT